MKWLFLSLFPLLFVCSLADKDAMLESNRIPSDVSSPQYASTCNQCQSLVKRFVEASHDEMKMRELKALLNVLCHETSYVDECRVFVNNIDSIIHKLEPYLADALRVCKSFHMCSNYKLDAFRRIGMLYVKKTMDKAEGLNNLVCDECQFAARELRQLVEDKEKQAALREFFAQQICIHAGSYRGMCDMLVEQFLPEMFQELDAVLQDTKKACHDVGFCAIPGAKSSKLTMLPSPAKSVHPLLSFWSGAKTLQSTHGSVLMTCLECKIAADGFLLEAEDNRNGIANDVQDLVCLHVLPSNFTPSCEDFMSMYLPTVLYMTIEQFSGEGICTAMHTCDSVSLSRMQSIPKTEMAELKKKSCVGVQEYIKVALPKPEVQHNFVAASQQHCALIPAVFQPMCHTALAGIVPRMMNRAAAMAGEGRFC